MNCGQCISYRPVVALHEKDATKDVWAALDDPQKVVLVQTAPAGWSEPSLLGDLVHPADLDTYQLVVHCGACMINRQKMLSRLARAREAGVPMVNYGVLLAAVHGLLERAVRPFPAAHLVLEEDEVQGHSMLCPTPGTRGRGHHAVPPRKRGW